MTPSARRPTEQRTGDVDGVLADDGEENGLIRRENGQIDVDLGNL